MSSPLFQQLEIKVEQALETIELLRLQLEESEERYATLEADNAALKNRQMHWENSLAALLHKLEGADLSSSVEAQQAGAFEEEEVAA